jgi:hypothetical protein
LLDDLEISVGINLRRTNLLLPKDKKELLQWEFFPAWVKLTH